MKIRHKTAAILLLLLCLVPTACKRVEKEDTRAETEERGQSKKKDKEEQRGEKKKKAEEAGIPTSHGQFGADMKVSLVNDGPFTIMYDSDAT